MTVKVLVTGADGFIGRHLRRRLRADSGYEPIDWSEDILDIAESPIRADAVVHLAARSRAADFHTDPFGSERINVGGTQAVMEYCKRHRARCVFPSTCAVYGTSHRGAISETAETAADSPYALSKLRAEEVCVEASEELGLGVTILRIFNPYGAGQDTRYLPAYVTEQVRIGRPVVVKTPNVVLDFIFIDDVVDAMVRAVSRVGDRAETFNIGTGVGTSVAELVERAIALGGGGSADVSGADLEVADRVVADCTYTAQTLGWSYGVSLSDGLQRLLSGTVSSSRSRAGGRKR